MKKILTIALILSCLSINVMAQNISIDFYGTMFEIPIDKSFKLSMNGANENEFDRAWRQLSRSKLQPTVLACQNLKNSMNLNGWAMFKLASKIGDELVTEGVLEKNEAAVFETYMLVQLGYNARVACINDQYLFVACPTDERFASVLFLPHDGMRYYVLTDNMPQDPRGRIFPLNVKELKDAKVLDLSNPSLIKFGGEYLPPRMYRSTIDKKLYVTIRLNKGMMDFFTEMPQVIDLDFYLRQPLSPDVERQLIPKIKKVIGKKSETKAANMLLHFMHSAFKYKTDGDNYGYERSYFKEEMFYHTYSDCEDRSILFSYLVKEILRLESVVLEYPGHVSTGVKFKKKVSGDKVTVEGTEYVLCDPSLLKSNVGVSNPKYENVAAYIYNVKLDGN